MRTRDESVADVRQYHPDGEAGASLLLEIQFDSEKYYRSTCIIRDNKPLDEQLDIFLTQFKESVLEMPRD